MAYCSKCGAKLEPDARFCPQCGSAVPRDNSFEETFNNMQQTVSETFTQINDTPNFTGEYDPQDINRNTVMAALSYLSFLVLVPIFAAKDSPFARFHANQGLILFLAGFLWGILYRAVRWILFYGILYRIIGILGAAVDVVFAVLALIGVINALKGQAKELPLIGSIKLLR